MEHRKEYGSPRDMLDDALLQRVLADMADDDSRRCCARSGSPRHEQNKDTNRSGEHSGCGCRGNERCGSIRLHHDGCGCQIDESASVSHASRQSCSRCRNQVQSRQDMQNEVNCHDPDSCISGKGTAVLQGLSLAMVYSPNQEWEGILEAEEALAKGTLFSGLLFPWYPSRCHDGRDCGCGRD